jgi:quercetin dioxygenase-like cupin family protein
VATVLKETEIAPKAISEIAQRRLLTGKNLMIQCVEAKAGAEFQAHSHAEEQMGYVIRGSIEFFLGEDAESVVMEAGTFFHFAPHERHASRALEDVMIIDVFSPPRPEYVEHSAQTGGDAE